MCEDLEVFNSIRMVVFSLDLVRAQALGRSAEGKRTEQWSGARSRGPCVLVSQGEVRKGTQRSEVPCLSVCLPTGSVTSRGPW